VIYRQLRSQPVNSSSALRIIAILLIVGLIQTVRFLTKYHALPLTYAAIGGSLGTATIVLYLAITLGLQRIIVVQRAHRLQLGGPAWLG
jgi:hypothetical protein